MRLPPLHSWELTAEGAIALQQELRDLVELDDRLPEVERVAGVDASYEESRQRTRAAVAVFSFPGLEPVDHAVAHLPTAFPYVPGLLSFREMPAVLAALEQLEQRPDLLLCDGQGYAHPRRFGLACHLGLWTDLPSIGVAKSRFVGQSGQLPEERGQLSPLTDGGEIVGAAVRTRSRVKPVYVSVGHRISLPTAVAWVLRATPRYRLPEPIRRAHRLAAQ